MIMDRVAAAFSDRGERDRLDGLTISGPDWWVNVRPSNTEPCSRLNVEAADRGTMEALRDETLGLISAANKADSRGKHRSRTGAGAAGDSRLSQLSWSTCRRS